MKKTLLLLLVIGAGAAANKLQAQGTVFLNNYDSRQGIYLYAPLPAPAGTPFEILGGPTLAAMVPLVSSSGQGPVFTIPTADVEALGPQTGSYFDVGYGSVPGVLPGEMALFTLRAWLGSTSWDSAVQRVGAVWSQRVGAVGDPAQLEIPTPLSFPFPEPSTLALGTLALAIFGFRDWCKRSRGSADSAPDLTDPRPSQPRRGPQRGPG